MAQEQVVVFHLGKEEYGVPIHQVREIIQYKGATKMPGAPAFFEGIINLRGKIIPVIDLAAKFGVDAQSGQRQALVIELAEQTVGVVVDTVSEVLWLEDSAIEAPPAQATARDAFIRGIGKNRDRLLILLELNNVMARDEWSAVQAAS
ncbi:MAG: chemotaxis protein CheW [Negativicutes bacterium]|nr:chemotaxis protein CheW [Negativicutes bacterium]MDR3590739.1 chemotaxis protein CheW [Negativicutes bacterium]